MDNKEHDKTEDKPAETRASKRRTKIDTYKTEKKQNKAIQKINLNLHNMQETFKLIRQLEELDSPQKIEPFKVVFSDAEII